ncbi:MAG: double-cubane-cluster-containing anaerobic reductase [Acidobacteriota bacterium]|nr:double-cubane-cluster-containing anaerobic reductase [Acidobacteriota bacterium]
MPQRPSPEDGKLWAELGLDVELHARILESISANFERQVESRPGRPAGMAYFDGVIHGSHGDRVREVMAKRAAGAKFVGTFCVYVPEEILIALGTVHLALCGGTAVTIPYAEQNFPRNMCPLVKSTLGLALSGTCPYSPLEDLAVGETTCDAKKKTWDVLGREGGFHVLELPQKKNPADRALWLEEVRTFTRRIEALTGNALDADKLAGAVRLMNRKRRALARMHDWRKADCPPISGTDALVVMQAALIDDPERFTLNLESLNEELAERAASGLGALPPGAKRILIAGCPSVLGNWKVHHIVETSGGAVVVDESCTGTRYFTGLVDESPADRDGLIEAIADRYLTIDCSCFSPNAERMANAVRMAGEYRAAGVVQYVLHACHTYNVEAIAMADALKAAGIPSIKIETDYSEEDAGQLQIRIEAFIESLEFRHGR